MQPAVDQRLPRIDVFCADSTMSQYIARQIGWLAAPLLLIVALTPLFVMLFVLCGLFVGVSQRIATWNPTNTGAQSISESPRLPENKLGDVVGRLVLNWLAVVPTLIVSLQTTIVLLFWSVAKLSYVRILSVNHTRIRHLSPGR
jgi:hypothetical protein